MITIVNNGNRLAQDMAKADLLKDGMTLDQVESIARQNSDNSENNRFMLNDDFWEDFAYMAEELGYKLAY